MANHNPAPPPPFVARLNVAPRLTRASTRFALPQYSEKYQDDWFEYRCALAMMHGPSALACDCNGRAPAATRQAGPILSALVAGT